MLAPVKHILDTKRIVLASSSPRRQELVKNIGLNAELCPSTFEENLNPKDFETFSEFIESTAQGKADEVFERLCANATSSTAMPDLVIAADTMVTMGDNVYGKPRDAKDAIRILTELVDGKCNTVFTGVVLKYPGGNIKFTETAKVFFGNCTKEQIEAYVATGHPLDKAGAYGISGMGGSMIEKIDGDFYTVMGLPLYKLSTEICKLLGR